MSPGAPVLPLADGRVALRLGPEERRVLGSIVAELRAELDDPASGAPDGSLARLYPPAFPDDAEAEASYVDLVRASLVDARRQRLALVEGTLDSKELDAAHASAWLTTLNDLRLVIGTGLGIVDDGDDPGAGDPDGRGGMRAAVYAYLGWLVGAFVDALAGGLPDVPDEAA